MNFKIRVKDVGFPDSSAWTEDHEVNDVHDRDSAEKWACKVVAQFNSNLRQGESPRVLVGVEVGDEGVVSRPTHSWEKSNAATLIKAGQTYDEYRCKVCGVTGKRFQVDSGIVRDAKYRKPIYARCDTALEHINKLRIAAKKRDAKKRVKVQ